MSRREAMAVDWKKPGTWVVAGVVIMIIGAVIAQLGDIGDDINPVIAVGGVFVLIGAFTWAIRRGLESGQRD